jgi:hypothetical protein
LVVVIIVLLAAAGVGIGLAVSHSSTSPNTSTSTTSASTSTPSTTATTSGPTTSGPVPGTTTVAVATVVCSTTNGVPVTHVTPPPATVSVTGVPADLTTSLSVYTDANGVLRVVGPRGWTCQAKVAADGSAQVVVVPPGNTPTVSGPYQADGAAAVAASTTSACAGCTVGQACPLFPAAATAYQSEFGAPCPHTRPAAEQVFTVSSTVMGFSDPPQVAGSGVPSGGSYTAHGVMTYVPGSQNGSFLDTCTVADSLMPLCTVSLDNFWAAYGTA